MKAKRIQRKLNTYISLMHKQELDNVYIHYMAYLTFLHLKDKKLKKAVRASAKSDVTRISMSLISLTLRKIYPVTR